MKIFSPEAPQKHPTSQPESIPEGQRVSNDPLCGTEGEKNMFDLFERRRAHELILSMGFRKAGIDSTAVAAIKNEMAARGFSEEAYEEYKKDFSLLH